MNASPHGIVFTERSECVFGYSLGGGGGVDWITGEINHWRREVCSIISDSAIINLNEYNVSLRFILTLQSNPIYKNPSFSTKKIRNDVYYYFTQLKGKIISLNTRQAY